MEQFFYAAVRFLGRLYNINPSIFMVVVVALLVGGITLLALIFVVYKRKADQRELAAWVSEKQTKGRKNFEAEVPGYNGAYQSGYKSAHFLDLFSRQWTQEEREALPLRTQARLSNKSNS